MPAPHFKLRDACENEKRVTVTETDGTAYEECIVDDCTHFRTATFEVWRFALRFPYGKKRIFGTELESVEVHD